MHSSGLRGLPDASARRVVDAKRDSQEGGFAARERSRPASRSRARRSETWSGFITEWRDGSSYVIDFTDRWSFGEPQPYIPNRNQNDARDWNARGCQAWLRCLPQFEWRDLPGWVFIVFYSSLAPFRVQVVVSRLVVVFSSLVVPGVPGRLSFQNGSVISKYAISSVVWANL